ncbi:MMPL family transporter [Corynebacterium variabile]|uniref:MMPL family transporter n=1 Tax=Corynebacterium variabile TaxID=1727 RepID=UPI003BAEB8A3
MQRHPRRILAVWALFFIVTAALATQLTGAVKAGGFTDSHADSVQAQKIAQQAFGDPENQLTVSLTSDNAITPADLDKASDAAASIDHVTGVVDGRTISSLTSDSGRTQVLQVSFGTDNTTTQNSTPHLRDALSDALDGTGIDSHVTGAAALDYDLNIQSQKDALHAELIAFPLLIIILLLVYRAIGPVLITMATAAVCLAGTQGIGTLVAWNIDTSNFYTTAGSLIGLAVSVDYCLFLLSRYKEGLSRGQDSADALRSATATAGHAIRFGGLCVVAALCALFWARNMVFGSIAGAGIVVTLIAIAAVATFVPALVTVLGDKVFLGKLPGFTAVDKDAENHATDDDNNRTPVSLRHPVVVALAVVVPLLAVATPLVSLRLQVPVASASILPADADSRTGIEAVNEELDSRQLFPTNVIVEDSPDTSELTEQLADLPNVLTAVPADSPVAATTGLTMTGQSNGHQYTRIVLISTGDPDSDEAHDMVADAKDAARQWSDESGMAVYINGATVGGSEFDELVEGSIPWVIGIVVIISLALLGWAFRSWVLPVLAVVLNALVVAAAIGLLSAGWKLITGDAINSVTPLVIFAIIFGLSMDYMVLMASRMKEERLAGKGHADAIAVGMRKTSGLVVSAAVIMIGVFLSFTIAKISIIQELGIGLAIAVALDALIVRPFLLPAVLALLGDAAWGKVDHDEE